VVQEGPFKTKYFVAEHLTFKYWEVRLLSKPVLDVLQVTLSGVHILVQLFPDDGLHVYIRLYERHLQQGKSKVYR
jgi:hypothetical protein